MTDLELLNYIESRNIVILTDDAGNWAAVTPGPQAVPEDPGHDVEVTVTVPHAAWRKSLREAVLAYVQEDII
jgi:hypothetical protein